MILINGGQRLPCPGTQKKPAGDGGLLEPFYIILSYRSCPVSGREPERTGQ